MASCPDIKVTVGVRYLDHGDMKIALDVLRTCGKDSGAGKAAHEFIYRAMMAACVSVDTTTSRLVDSRQLARSLRMRATNA